MTKFSLALAFAGLGGCICIDHPPVPNDYLFRQRAYPYQDVPSDAYYTAVAWAQGHVRQRNGQTWEFAGPTNVGGRITDIAMHASDQQTIYAASASGGVWKSKDTGANWQPISDGLPSLSIGDIAIDPSDKNTLYCGTGETNGGGGSVTYDGRGVFKSSDGGASWTSLGLENTGSIGRIEVDPKNPNRIFVAAMGRLFGNNPERGLYRSTDGGQSWTQQLYINDSTGVIDLVIHPFNPDTVFAVTWQRTRRPDTRQYGGPGCGIYRSTDGGDTWTKLGMGLPAINLGRIGIALAPSSPNILYATVADSIGFYFNTYKSTNLGNSWLPLPPTANPTYSSFGWWFGQIRVDPTNQNRVYNLGLDWVRSTNGGNSWGPMGGNLHVDHHALYIHPANPNLMAEGNDGGLYISADGGNTWNFRALPITQFYTSEIDFQEPERLSGGTQDNGTWRAIVQTPGTWEHIWGGDGFVTLTNPNNPTIWYAESQYGGFGGSNGAGSPPFARSNWNTPYVFDPNNPATLYFGGERMFRSTNAGLNWTAISGDLSNGPGASQLVLYGTITTIAVSPADTKVIWAGTDDGNVWVTPDGGANWSKVSDALPNRWVTRITADPYDPATAYVCFSGFRHFDDIAHVYKTTDMGQHWTSVSGDLPDIPVNDLIIDPLATGHLIIATDAGVFSSEDDGQHWSVLGEGLPNVPVLDLTFHAPTRALVAATYGRSMFRTMLPPPVGTNEPTAAATLQLEPNPVAGLLTLTLPYPDRRQDIRIWSADGRLVWGKTTDEYSTELSIDARNWPAGVYVVSVDGLCRKVIKR